MFDSSDHITLAQSSTVQSLCLCAHNRRCVLCVSERRGLCRALRPRNPTFTRRLLTVCADTAILCCNRSSLASCFDDLRLSRKEIRCNSRSSLAVVMRLRPLLGLFENDPVSWYLLIVVRTAHREHFIFFCYCGYCLSLRMQ